MGSLFKCQECGFELTFKEGAKICECEACGTKQPLPRILDDRIASLYEKAEHYRKSNDFDRAMSAYDKIIDEDDTDAEAHWSYLLCKYGIEYVDDPYGQGKKPTIHRIQKTFILDDPDYIRVLDCADDSQSQAFTDKATEIGKIQKKFLEISSKEAPYDIFICFKESELNNPNSRTEDSLIAEGLYNQLVKEGYKVFFSRITLEDKLGEEYEPYIFAALTSAKVMLAIGTDIRHYESEWVKNEWTRYLGLIAAGEDKKLFPVYKYMEPKDLPAELTRLQGVDISRPGSDADIVRAIKKIVKVDEEPAQKVIMNAVGDVDNMYKRAMGFLAKSKWEDAQNYAERVLDINLEYADAYLVKLMAKYKCQNLDVLSKCDQPYDRSEEYDDYMHYSKDEDTKNALKKMVSDRIERLDRKSKDEAYNEGLTTMALGDKISFEMAKMLFEKAGDYKDAKELAEKCGSEVKRITTEENQAKYDTAMSKYIADNVDSINEAKELFNDLGDFSDSKDMMVRCDEKIIAVEAKLEADRKERVYQGAVGFLKSKYISDVEGAKRMLTGLGDYKDSKELIAKCDKRLKAAARKAFIKKHKKAFAILTAIVVVGLAILIWSAGAEKRAYGRVDEYFAKGDYDRAYSELNKIGTPEAKQMIHDSKYDRAQDYISAKRYDDAYILLNDIGATDEVYESLYKRGNEALSLANYDEAYALLERCIDYKDSRDIINKSKCSRAQAMLESGNVYVAYMMLLDVDGSSEAGNLIAEIEASEDPILTVLKDAHDKREVQFGTYEQDNDKNNGAEPIVWEVVSIDDKEMILVSKYLLDGCKFNAKKNSFTTWEKSDVRAYLNGKFYDNAFTKEEKAVIKTTHLSVSTERGFNNGGEVAMIDNGPNTEDKVYLMSYDEYFKYYPEGKDFECTAYATDKLAVVTPDNKAAVRLRTPFSFVGLYDAHYSIEYDFINLNNKICKMGCSSASTEENALGMCPVIRIAIANETESDTQE